MAATDRDNDTLTYTLRGVDADSFGINRRTGQLLAKAALDYETKDSYSLRALVSDGKGGSDIIDLTVMVTDVDEPPAIARPVAIKNDGIWTRYDLNNNGMIERGEAVAAAFDYFKDIITKQQALEVVALYFAS